MCKDNWTGAEEERQDCVDNEIQSLIENLAGQEVDWDMENIGEVRDVLQDIIVDKLKLKTEQEFYPYREIKPEEKKSEVIIVTEEQLMKATKKALDDLDADDFAQVAGDLLGGYCWWNVDNTYSFEPDEYYGGAFDWLLGYPEN